MCGFLTENVVGRTTQGAFVCQNASVLLCATLKYNERDSPYYSENHFVYLDQLNKTCLAVIEWHLTNRLWFT